LSVAPLRSTPMNDSKGFYYSTTTKGSYAYLNLSECRYAEMTQADWAEEQLLILAGDNPVTRDDFEHDMAHLRDTIVSGEFKPTNPEAAKRTCDTCTYAIEHLDSLLRELRDCGLISRTKEVLERSEM
jgi:hypothetical protein